EAVGHVNFRTGEATAIDVRAVGQKSQHTGSTQLGKPVDVKVLAIDWRLVDLEVTSVDDHAARRFTHDRDTIRHAVGDAEKLQGKRANLHPLAWTHTSQPRPARLVAFFQL